MIEPTINLSYNGQPMRVLERLIQKRCELLKESARDAVVATAILVLQSLRKETKVYKKKTGVRVGRG